MAMLATKDSLPHATGAVVLVDDNSDDLFFLRRKLEQLGVTAPIVAVHDGHEAIEFLKQVCIDHRADLFPEILFLDLKMPRTTGFSVLCWLREQEAFKDLKVVILSDSDDPGDIALATALDADAYVAKHPGNDRIAELLRRFAPGILAPQTAATSAA